MHKQTSLTQADKTGVRWFTYASRQDWCQVAHLLRETRLASGGLPKQVDKIGIRRLT